MEIESKYRSLPFWSWNDKLEKEKLFEQMQWMKDNGIGGFFMHARGGLKTEYLGEEWFNLINECIKKAEELGMEAYAYDENGWPSGFCGGKLLKEEKFRDRFLTYSISDYDEKAYCSYKISSPEIVRAKSGKCLNIYLNVSPSTVDILNPEVVKAFINETHEKYKAKCVKGLKGFFTDEPQYYANAMPFTPCMIDYYKQKYNEDILDKLGLLFVKKKGYREFRYRYWKGMQELMLTSFAKQIYDFCDENGYKLTGHYIEERRLAKQILYCGGIMPFYEYQHIPGIDFLGGYYDKKYIKSDPELFDLMANSIGPKQLGSVCAQLGKRQSLCEIFAMCGWDATPLFIKQVAELCLINGVTIICQHLLPYSEGGQRKRDFPIHFTKINPWINKNYRLFNDYIAYLGKILTESTPVVKVCVLSPIRSLYFNYKQDGYEQCYGVKGLDDSFATLTDMLDRKHIQYHYVDETLLAKYGSVKGKKLVMGECEYDYLILPKMITMDVSTEKLLREYVKNGGKVFIYKDKPTYLEGKEFNYGYLESNCDLSDMQKIQPYKVVGGKDVKVCYKVDNDGKPFIYAVNFGKKQTATINIGEEKSLESLNLFTGDREVVSNSLVFNEGQAYVLYPSDKKAVKAYKHNYLTLSKEFTLDKKYDNYLPLDFVKYSFDGKNYSEKMFTMAVLDKLLNDRYKGKLYLKYDFNVKEKTERYKIAIEHNNVTGFSINGKEITDRTISKLESNLALYDVSDFVHSGINEVVMELDYYQNDNLYYALFGEGVTESLKNCMVYDTTVESIYVMGDFGVYGDLEPCKDERLVLGDNFYLGKQKNKVSGMIQDGFPFYRGDVKFTGHVNVTDTNLWLKLDNPYQSLEIFVNDKKVGDFIFDKEVDLSKYLKSGDNKIDLVITYGNRNLLGVSHSVNGNINLTYPSSFEMFGSWKGGDNPNFTKKYYLKKDMI